MFKANSIINNAAASLQEAFKEGNEEMLQKAFEQFGEAIKNTVAEDFMSANGDKDILLQRGFRVLTSKETDYYQKLIEAGKSDNPKQVYSGLLNSDAMPTTIIEDVYKNLTEEHPLLSRINFVSVEYMTKWILNDHSAQTAVWGAINSQITEEITSAFQTIQVAQNKLSAFAMIEKDMLDLGPTFLDGYIRTFLKESVAKALEVAIVSGTGKDEPIGLDRDIHHGVSTTAGAYPQKTAVAITSFSPEEYGAVLATLAVTESYTENNVNHGGKLRMFDEVTMICNQVDYLSKVMPATTVMTSGGAYARDLFPFPTEVIRSNAVPTGKAIVFLPEEYFFGLGSSKEGAIEYSDDFKFLEDKRVFKIKLFGNGRPFDNTVAVLLDISDLDPAYLNVKVAGGTITTTPTV